ncbi:hypothetical protein LRS03_26340, partial [Rhizobacter sp. J219]|uniref:hypothetical protein n=1 Tax=Rhizobacter sp. J219 TaxID=2898430 RepID=UPI0021518C7A
MVQTLDLGLGSRPFGVVFNPLGTAAFVTLQGSGRVLQLRRAGKGRGRQFATRHGDLGRFQPAARHALHLSPADRGEVVEINPSAFVVTRTFALATDPVAPASPLTAAEVPKLLRPSP